MVVLGVPPPFRRSTSDRPPARQGERTAVQVRALRTSLSSGFASSHGRGHRFETCRAHPREIAGQAPEARQAEGARWHLRRPCSVRVPSPAGTAHPGDPGALHPTQGQVAVAVQHEADRGMPGARGDLLGRCTGSDPQGNLVWRRSWMRNPGRPAPGRRGRTARPASTHIR
jgi:hypothetical protein